MLSIAIKERSKVEPASLDKQKRGRRSFLLLAILAAQVLALLFVETVLAGAGIGEEDISLPDKVLGFRHRKNKRVTWRSEGYAVSYFDANGLRDAGVSRQKAPGTLRVALMGDSMTEALQVPLEQTFGKLVQAHLHQAGLKNVEFINFGVCGYSTIQEYLYLQEVLEFNPDLVVLCYNARDMAENIESWAPAGLKARASRPFAIKLKDRPLEISSTPVEISMQQPLFRLGNYFDWFKQNSRIYGALIINRPKVSLENPLINEIIRLIKYGKQSFSFSSRKPDNQQKTGETQADRAINQQYAQAKAFYLTTIEETFQSLLEKMRDASKSKGAELMLVSLPGRCDLLELPEAAQAQFGVTYEQELSILKRACSSSGVSFIDCHNPVKDLGQEKISQMFYVLHLTPSGHQYVAGQLSNPLLDKLAPKI